MFLQKFGKPRFMDRRDSCVDQINLPEIDIDTDNVMPKLCETRACDRSDIPGSDDRNVHETHFTSIPTISFARRKHPFAICDANILIGVRVP